MFRRVVVVIAAAVALIVTPTAAAFAAYNAPGYNATVSDASPATGQTFEAVLTGAAPNQAITLTITSDPASISSDSIQIAGTKALTRAANANGVATFQVTLSAVGTYTLTFTNAAGAVLATQTVTVHMPSASAIPGSSAAASGGELSRTGSQGGTLAASGGILVLLGAGALMFARRRKTARLNS